MFMEVLLNHKASDKYVIIYITMTFSNKKENTL